MVEGQGRGDARSQTWLVPGENPLDATTRTHAAIEVACLDLIGKTIGQSVCDLLGGRVRDAVPFSAPIHFTNTPAAAAKETMLAKMNTVKRLSSGGHRLASKANGCEIRFRLDQIQRRRTRAGSRDRNDKADYYRVLGTECPAADRSQRRLDRRDVCPRRARHGRRIGPRRVSGRPDRRAWRTWLKCGSRLLAEGIETPLASQCRRHLFRRYPAQSGAGRRPDHSLRPPLLGRDARRFNTWPGSQNSRYRLSMHSNSHLGVSLDGHGACTAATPHFTYACDTHYPWQSRKTK